MSDRTWTVEVGGVSHTVVVDVDPQTKRAGVRVDGRMAAKPLAADEDERELKIDGAPYLLRRVKDDFELDIAPDAFLNQRTAAPPPPKSRKLWIAYVGAALFVLGLIRVGMHGFQYMRVPWQPYSESDGSFNAKFPAKPDEKETTQNINGDLWTVHSRYATFKDHFYAVEYLDLKIVVVDANSESVMNRFLDGWAHALGGSIASREKSSLGRNPAIRFEIALPKGAGAEEHKLPVNARVRGVETVRGTRLYLTWTMTAEADSATADVRQFLDAFNIPPPGAPASFESAVADRHAEPVQSAAVPPAATSTQPDPNQPRLGMTAPAEPAPIVYLEPAFVMYHVAGCPKVTPNMQQVPVDLRPNGFTPHDCVPQKLRTWPIRYRRKS